MHLFRTSVTFILTYAYLVHGAFDSASISSVTPGKGSANGETRITIYGQGFAENQFNFMDDSDLGNKVELISSTRSLDCPVHKDGTHQTQIMCYTPREIGEDTWTVRVSVDGQKVPTSNHCSGNAKKCQFTTTLTNTPKIRRITPIASLPGELVMVHGEIFTNKFDNAVEASCNGREDKFLRVYINGGLCQLRNPNENDEYYGIGLDKDCKQPDLKEESECVEGACDSDWGYFKCLNSGSYIGNQNASFIISDSFGRSLPLSETLKVNALGGISMYQTYAAVSGLSAHSGSIEGMTLTIEGQYFDESDFDAQVTVGGQPCEVTELTQTSIVCNVPAEPQDISYDGNRGVIRERFGGLDSTDNTAYSQGIDALSTMTNPDEETFFNQLQWSETNGDAFLTRHRGFIVPPHDNEYTFYVKGDDDVKLYLSTDDSPGNKRLVAQSSPATGKYFTKPEQKSDRFQLDGGQKYYYEVHHSEGAATESISVALHMYRTEFIGKQAGNVKNEQQVIELTSSVTNEEFTYGLRDWTLQSPTAEVQKITIGGSSDEAQYRIGMHGVYTAALAFDTTADAITAALNALPTISPSTVSVSLTSSSSSGIEFVVTFSGDEGNWPDFDVIATANENNEVIGISPTVNEESSGVPSMSTYRLNFNGLPSQPIASSASADEVKTAIVDMFQVTCPSAITNPTKVMHYFDYESNPSSVEFWNGKRVNDIPPFCGRYALKNPGFIFLDWGDNTPSVNAKFFKFLCFAYYGRMMQRIDIHHTWTTDNVDSTLSWDVFEADLSVTDRWGYTCFDMFSEMKARHPDLASSQIHRIVVYKEQSAPEYYVDEVYIGGKKTIEVKSQGLADYQRLVPQRWVLDDLQVSMNNSDYHVTLSVMNCESNLPLLGVSHAQEQNREANSVEYRDTAWTQSSKIAVNRIQSASPPISGTFSITYDGQTLPGIPAAVEPELLKTELETLDGVGSVTVTREGICSAYSMTVDFVAGAPGDHPQMEVDAAGLTGTNVDMNVTTPQDGGVFFDPIMGDMLRTYHEKPQVVVTINGIPSQCTGDCDFEWSSSSTPRLTAINPNSGSSSAGTVLTLTGSGFSTQDNRVSIGGVECLTTINTATEIQCSVGDGPAGSHEILVESVDIGKAQHDGGPFEFTYEFLITGISPTVGSIAGGTRLNVTGTGFGSKIGVTIGGTACEIVFSDYDLVICITPPGVGVTDVVASDGSNSHTSSQQFTYSGDSVPTLTSMNSSDASVAGGTVIELSGSSLGDSQPSDHPIHIFGKAAEVLSWSDTAIDVVLPSLGPGSYPLIVEFEDGYADTSALSNVTYHFEVLSVGPLQGSLYGGTEITVTGNGFTEGTTVSIGEIPCIAESVLVDLIVCKTGSSARVYKVTNMGSNPVYGTGYAWTPNPLTIRVGDYVEWSWGETELIDGIGFRVEQTPNGTASVYSGSGFRSSASKSEKGVFKHQFTNPGTYHYWSGCVDHNCMIKMRGTVRVVDEVSVALPIKVKMGEYEADYNPSNNGKRKKRSACTNEEDSISTCTSGLPTSNVSSTFSFSYFTCSTPTVDFISTGTGLSTDEIEIRGTGFGSESCQNEVQVGSHECVVQSSTTTRINCTLDPNNDMEIGTPYEVKVKVSNRGIALNAINDERARRFALVPHVSNLSPSSGSTAGGTKLTIHGSGFIGQISVSTAGSACNIETQAYTEIICLTSAGFASTEDVVVSVMSNGQWVDSECPSGCEFTFESALSPTLLSVSPETIDIADMTLTLTGNGFGSDVNDIVVRIGEEFCEVLTASDTQITCNTGSLVAGTQPLLLKIGEVGYAVQSIETIDVSGYVTSVSPVEGSIVGGNNIIITGFGFHNNSEVQIGANICPIVSVTHSEIICTVPSSELTTDSDASVSVSANSYSYQSTTTYTYNLAQTPTIASISPTVGSSGDVVTISGDMFGSTSDTSVVIGGEECVATSVSVTSISCMLGPHSAGTFEPVVFVTNKGFAVGTVSFTYELSADSITPSSGSFSGGQIVVISGTGFDETETTVTLCGSECEIIGTPSSTSLECVTPQQSVSGGTKQCAVEVSVGDATESLSSQYTYDSDQTPTITSIDPARGGTGGGTLVTITGSGFGAIQSDVSITIGGSECEIQSYSTTEVVCKTGARKPSTKTKVRLEVGSQGIAVQDNADFEYIDLWSSLYSWGGTSLPEEGDLVVIPADMTMVLDVDTPIIKLLLIRGGKLIFDEVDVELNAEVILITDGGLLQVGTEDEPFQHKGIITMHGHVRSKEIPIYGTKVIAVREGSLELHGKDVGKTWTQLGSTSQSGSNTIELKEEMSWEVGDEIIIATTGTRLSQGENEVRKITAIAGTTLTLDEALEYKHLGETVQVGPTTLEARAEVGLLTHNVVVRGSNDPQWHDTIEKCEAGFDPGEFATQTCFQGRFGEEIGNDQFGATIMFHATRPGEQLVVGHIENTEVTYAGQAFRLGRYAIHFHLNGDMNGTYVRHCSIHQSFNRAINVHGTHRVMMEHNVAYNIMGGAFFTEDGVETNNIYQYNLAVFVKSSTSLQNDDITPAAFWVTNPNNIVRHNHAVGGTHFGFWYRMHAHPDGPSFDPNICPRKVPLGLFFNNTVHSHGWFGVWIFQHYFPMVDGDCQSTIPYPADFKKLISWNCEKGAETVGGGAIQFTDFLFVNNDVTGYEFKIIEQLPASFEFTNDGPLLANGVIAATGKGVLDEETSSSAVILPYAYGMKVSNVTFVDYDQSNQGCLAIASIDGKTEDFNGGFEYHLEGLSFVNSPSKTKFRWIHDAVFVDRDGSLSGISSGVVVPEDDALPDSCSPFDGHGTGVQAYLCPSDVKFHRFAFNNPAPISLAFKEVSFTNQYGTTIVPFKSKRVTHPKGWMVLLADGETYTMEFINADHITNISYTGKYFNFKDDDFLIIGHNFTQRADFFQVFPGDLRNESQEELSSDSMSGDWTFDDDLNFFKYALSSKTESNPTGERDFREHYKVDLDVYQCFYAACIPPPEIVVEPPPENRPEDAVFWSQEEAWAFSEEGYGSYYGPGDYGPPNEFTDVKIPSGVWMVLDVPLEDSAVKINKLYIYGVLEFEPYLVNGKYLDITLSATHIIINGGRLIVGTEDFPFRGEGIIELRGNHYTPELPMPNGPNLGAKALGVFGGLDMHGIPRNTTWTQLASSVESGSQTITVIDDMDWGVGDEIVIASTSYQYSETETRQITSINGQTLTLESPLEHDHYAVDEFLTSGKTFKMAAEVGLLTRNVKIVGDWFEGTAFETDAFGARVLVSSYVWIEGGSVTEFAGHARLSDVEFYRAGQEGFVDSYDPRFALAFLDADYEEASYVKRCSFNYGYSPAVGVFGTDNIMVADNVIYRTIGSSMKIEGSGHVISHNLVLGTLFPGTYMGREEQRIDFDAAIEIQESTGITFVNNHAASSQRAGIRFDGERCDADSLKFSGNVAHSSLIGLILMIEDGLPPCSIIKDFASYRNWDYGLYFQTDASVIVDNYISIDNGLGLFPFIFGPPAISHQFANKYVEVKNSHFVGSSSVFDCDDNHPDDKNFELSGTARSWRTNSGGVVGVSMGSFSSKSNSMPKKPFAGIKAYQAIGGSMRMLGNTFAKFGTSCGTRENVVISTNPSNEDGIHPVEISDTTFHSSPKENRVYFHRPSIGKINPADCVDMPCDGKREVLLRDEDGSFLESGASGSVIGEAEWEWDGDPRLGLGDYRIPKVMLTELDGTRIQVEDKCPEKGIFKDDTCTYVPSYRGWECHGPDYVMLMLENMDHDTETRRLSPIAVHTGDYVDLINGPQDHGWCMGYTCQKRLSTFPIVMASGREYEVFFTGTTPQNLRYHWLNTDSSQAVLIGVWYSQSWRLDVYCADSYVKPTNGYYNDNDQLLYHAPPSNDPRAYFPDVNSDPCGSNYWDRASNTLWVMLRGPDVLDVKTVERIMVSFDVPAMTVDEFFGEKIIDNLAMFLDIPKEKIRIAEAVSESRRRKRSDTETVTIVIENPPKLSANDSTVDPSDLTVDQMQDITSAIVTTYQLGDLASVLNITILSIAVTEPPPPSDSDQWTVLTEIEIPDSVTIQVPDALKLTVPPQTAHEGTPCVVQPSLQMTDSNGDVISLVGSTMDPWVVNASIVMLSGSDSNAELLGTTSASFSNGWATFTDIAISHAGQYKLLFEIVSPVEASHFEVQSQTLSLQLRSLTGQLKSIPNDTYANVDMDIEVEILDAPNMQVVEDLSWKGHSFSCQPSLGNSHLFNGELMGSTTEQANVSSSTVLFEDLSFTQPGRYVLTFECSSSPAMYSFTFYSVPIDIFFTEYVEPEVEVSKLVGLKFDGDFSVMAAGYEDVWGAAVYNIFWTRYQNVIFRDFDVYEGSIRVDFYIDGTEANVEDVTNLIWEDLKTPTAITINGHAAIASEEMWLEGDSFYGLDGPPSETANSGLEAWEIAIIVIVVLAAVGIAIGLFLLYKKKHAGKAGEKLSSVSPAPLRKRKSSYEVGIDAAKPHTMRQNTVFIDEYNAEEDEAYNSNVSSSSSSIGNSKSTLSVTFSDRIIIPSNPPSATSFPRESQWNLGVKQYNRHENSLILPEIKVQDEEGRSSPFSVRM